jgi:hypothetical protein
MTRNSAKQSIDGKNVSMTPQAKMVTFTPRRISSAATRASPAFSDKCRHEPESNWVLQILSNF